jgi:hypothetical protein
MTKLLIASLLATPMLSAQVVAADNCVHQAGDNPDWARPEFDDRQWVRSQPFKPGSIVWTRCRLNLSELPLGSSLHIGLKSNVAREIFIDGKWNRSFGDLSARFVPLRFEINQLRLDATDKSIRVFAFRQSPYRSFYNPGQFVFAVGTKEGLEGWRAISVLNELGQQWASLLFGGFTLVIGILLLILFLRSADGTQRAMLWLGVYCIALGLLRGRDFAMIVATNLHSGVLFGWTALTNAAIQYSLPHLFFALANRPMQGVFRWLAAAGGFVHLGLGSIMEFGLLEGSTFARELDFTWVVMLVMYSVILTAIPAFWPIWRVAQPIRQARTLSLILMLGLLIRRLTQTQDLSQMQMVALGANSFAALNLFVLMAFFVEIAQRHRTVSADRAALQSEMKSAQEVQRLLTSSTLDTAHWATVEVAYSPAKEVGGDFYFCRHTEEGQLVVVGDVSGKGLRAAMLASVALGALRHSSVSAPGPLLEGLNTALQGQTGGGFVTCCAALMRDDGHLLVANAGHPAPYVGGREFPVEAGLPLGIVPGAKYQESTGECQSITLVSDGVVEAENSQRELFGFDRTLGISTKSAREIAEAARAWGQIDDITVVTVRRRT